MARRCLLSVSTAILTICFACIPPSGAAPAFKFKKSFSTFEADRYPPSRAERRLISGASPIHFIQPFIGAQQPMNTYSNFFAPQTAPVGSPSSSSVFKLPLRLFTNGKPYAVFHGVPKNVMEYLPQAVSNIIRLPLKYISNAKPVGVYFKDPSFNYL